MELEESLLVLTKIKSSSEYESERETSTSSILSLYIFSFSTIPLISSLLTPIDFSFLYYNMS